MGNSTESVDRNCPHCGSEYTFFSRKRNRHVCEDCDKEFGPTDGPGPMRIFLSYGHDQNEELVLRIKKDLESRGHDVWFDKHRIKSGDDWRRSITNGIIESNRVLSFLSKHSTRDPGVCLDEIAIAIGTKGANIKTILVEPESVVQTPPSISHIQWLDMQGWRAKKAAGDATWQSWYQEKFEQIAALIESEKSRQFAGEIQTLNRYLKPVCSDTRIYDLLKKGFIGRQWLLDEIRTWSETGANDSRLFWLTGAPGVGKSAVAARMAHYGRDRIIAAQFCQWDKPDHNSPAQIVKNIAFQLAARLPDYRSLLLTLPEINDLGKKNAAELFDYLLVEPLGLTINGDRQRCLILIDALDEAAVADHNPLTELLARDAARLPDWLALIITSRPDPSVTAPLQGLNPYFLDTETDFNRQDIRLYLETNLKDLLAVRHRADELIDRILEKSEGVFLYVERVCEDISKGYLSLDRLDAFPQGLGGIFWQFFRRQFPDEARFKGQVRPALRAILAARDPLPIRILNNFFNWASEDCNDFCQALGSLFTIEDTSAGKTIKPYHKAVADWLSDDSKAGAYYVSIPDGHRLLAEAGLQLFRHDARNLPPYFAHHLFSHLLETDQHPAALYLLASSGYCAAKTAKASLASLLNEIQLALGWETLSGTDSYLLCVRYRTLLEEYAVGFATVMGEAQNGNHEQALEYAAKIGKEHLRLCALLYLIERCHADGIALPSPDFFWKTIHDITTTYTVPHLEARLAAEGAWRLLDRHLGARTQDTLQRLLSELGGITGMQVETDALLARFLAHPSLLNAGNSNAPAAWLPALVRVLDTHAPSTAVSQITALLKAWTTEPSAAPWQFLCSSVQECADAGFADVAGSILTLLLDKVMTGMGSGTIEQALVQLVEREIKLDRFLAFIATAFTVAPSRPALEILQKTVGTMIDHVQGLTKEKGVSRENVSLMNQLLEKRPRQPGLKRTHLAAIEQWLLCRCAPLHWLRPHGDRLVEAAAKIGIFDVEQAPLRLAAVRYLIKTGRRQDVAGIGANDFLVMANLDMLGSQQMNKIADSPFAEDTTLVSLNVIQGNQFVIRQILSQICHALLVGEGEKAISFAKRLAAKAAGLKKTHLLTTEVTGTYLEEIGKEGAPLFTAALYEAADFESLRSVLLIFADELLAGPGAEYYKFVNHLLSAALPGKDENPERFANLQGILLPPLFSLPFAAKDAAGSPVDIAGITESVLQSGDREQIAALDQLLGQAAGDGNALSGVSESFISWTVSARSLLGASHCWNRIVNPGGKDVPDKDLLRKIASLRHRASLSPEMCSEWLAATGNHLNKDEGLAHLAQALTIESAGSQPPWAKIAAGEGGQAGSQPARRLPRSTALFMTGMPDTEWESLFSCAEAAGVVPAETEYRAPFLAALMKHSADKELVFSFIDSHGLAADLHRFPLELNATMTVLEEMILATDNLAEENGRNWLNKIFTWFGQDPLQKELWDAFHDKGFGNVLENKMGNIYPVLHRLWPEVAHQAGIHYLASYDFSNSLTADKIVKTLWKTADQDEMEEIFLKILAYRSSAIMFPVNDGLFKAWLIGALHRADMALPLIEKNKEGIRQYLDIFPNDADRAQAFFLLALIFMEAACQGGTQWDVAEILLNKQHPANQHLDQAFHFLFRNRNKQPGLFFGASAITHSMEVMFEHLEGRSKHTTEWAFPKLRRLVMTIATQLVATRKDDSMIADLALHALQFEIRTNGSSLQSTFDFIVSSIERWPDSFLSVASLQKLLVLAAETEVVGRHRERISAAMKRLLQGHSDASHLKRYILPLIDTKTIPEHIKHDIRRAYHDAAVERPDIASLLASTLEHQHPGGDVNKKRAELLKKINTDGLDVALAQLMDKSTNKICQLEERWPDIFVSSRGNG